MATSNFQKMDFENIKIQSSKETISQSKMESISLALKQIQLESVQEIIRPELNLVLIFAKKILCLAITVLIFFINFKFMPYIKNHLLLSILVAVACLLAVCLIFAKKILITNIKLYQYFAPERIRKSCRFYPTCSNYAILAIEKYGAFKGFCKTVNRLLRCKIPNGGIDFP